MIVRTIGATAAAAGLALAPLASDARILSIPACGDTPRHLVVVPADPADPRKDGRECVKPCHAALDRRTKSTGERQGCC